MLPDWLYSYRRRRENLCDRRPLRFPDFIHLPYRADTSGLSKSAVRGVLGKIPLANCSHLGGNEMVFPFARMIWRWAPQVGRLPIPWSPTSWAVLRAKLYICCACGLADNNAAVSTRISCCKLRFFTCCQIFARYCKLSCWFMLGIGRANKQLVGIKGCVLLYRSFNGIYLGWNLIKLNNREILSI